jgi:hypothetical protein
MSKIEKARKGEFVVFAYKLNAYDRALILNYWSK